MITIEQRPNGKWAIVRRRVEEKLYTDYGVWQYEYPTDGSSKSQLFNTKEEAEAIVKLWKIKVDDELAKKVKGSIFYS